MARSLHEQRACSDVPYPVEAASMVLPRRRCGRADPGCGPPRDHGRASRRVGTDGSPSPAAGGRGRVRRRRPRARRRGRTVVPHAAAPPQCPVGGHRGRAGVPAARASQRHPPRRGRDARWSRLAPAPAGGPVLRGPGRLRRHRGGAARPAPTARDTRVGPSRRDHREHRRARQRPGGGAVRPFPRGRRAGRVVRPGGGGDQAGVDVGRPVRGGQLSARPGLPDDAVLRDRPHRGEQGQGEQLPLLRRRAADRPAGGVEGGGAGVRGGRPCGTHPLARSGAGGHRRRARVARALPRRR